MTVVLMATAILLIACGSGDGAVNWDNGDGGAGNTSATGSNTGSGSSGGSAEVCHPTMENGWCEGATNCECLQSEDEQAFCDAWKADGLCPDDGNKCTPGHNQCGYNLPKGADYQAPFEKCVPYLNSHWREVGPQYDGEIGNSWVANGQLSVGGIIQPSSSEAYGYYTSYSMSSNLLCWNLFNRDSFESAEGKISEDCETIDMSYFKPGSTEPYVTKQFVFIE
jgi:hypothetical protein